MEAVLAAYRAEGGRLVETARAVDLVERALRGEAFTPQLSGTQDEGRSAVRRRGDARDRRNGTRAQPEAAPTQGETRAQPEAARAQPETARGRRVTAQGQRAKGQRPA
jgi:hypothetical protein